MTGRDTPPSEGIHADIAAWKAERNAALEAMDMRYAENMMPKAAPEVRLMAMHKARYECTGISRDARLQSAAWMREHDIMRFTGTPVLPGKELPE